MEGPGRLCPENACLASTAGSKRGHRHVTPARRACAGEADALGGGQQAHAGLRQEQPVGVRSREPRVLMGLL